MTSKVNRRFVVFQGKSKYKRINHRDGSWTNMFLDQWFWHCKALNGEIVYASEGFSKDGAIKAAKREMQLLHCTTVLEVQE